MSFLQLLITSKHLDSPNQGMIRQYVPLTDLCGRQLAPENWPSQAPAIPLVSWGLLMSYFLIVLAASGFDS
ncbi:hypothetical protein [Microcoleus sp. FACHB-672]|uniref:hypothetical protein n=1 Tax=Microcoleus sp. FACHB-672 TaxID=2692825 RepID=UPI001682EDA7|nr:hypothetical protein [Microcoleus sp. FACHB-672]MBD2041071.1 hypothetical protein [Microcoleus sp. FACHB-672]